MSESQSVCFAKRRPGWEPSPLHAGLQLAPHNLDGGRQPCPSCGRSKVWYCGDCVRPFTPTPSVELPFEVRVVTHHEERGRGNTGVHAALLAPQQVQLVPFDQAAAHDAKAFAVLFPSEDAEAVSTVDLSGLKGLYIIDSRWAQATRILRQPEFKAMRKVKLSGTARSSYWRFHTKDVRREGVCSIEALYFCLKELQHAGSLQGRLADEHAFDNLLWYFAYEHALVQSKFLQKRQRLSAAQERSQQGDDARQSSCSR